MIVFGNYRGELTPYDEIKAIMYSPYIEKGEIVKIKVNEHGIMFFKMEGDEKYNSTINELVSIVTSNRQVNGEFKIVLYAENMMKYTHKAFCDESRISTSENKVSLKNRKGIEEISKLKVKEGVIVAMEEMEIE